MQILETDNFNFNAIDLKILVFVKSQMKCYKDQYLIFTVIYVLHLRLFWTHLRFSKMAAVLEADR